MSRHDRFRSMGCEIVVAGASPRVLRRIEMLFAERDRVFSRFRPDSELSRINRRRHGIVRVSALFAAALEAALDAAAWSSGLVDPTLGVAIDVKLDLNGVVKALAVDDALELLDGDGFVPAGGDLAARGEIDVAMPGGGAVRLVRGALATSGSSARAWLRGGRLQHHLIDPGTGSPAESPWEQVTVCGASCVTADVAAKAAFLLAEAGPDWLDERGLPGRFLAHGGVEVVNKAWHRDLAGAFACT